MPAPFIYGGALAVAPTVLALRNKLGMTGTDSVLASNTDLDYYSNRVGDVDGYDTSQIMKNFVNKDPLANLNKLITPDQVAKDEVRERDAQALALANAPKTTVSYDPMQFENESRAASAAMESYYQNRPSNIAKSSTGVNSGNGGKETVKGDQNSLSPLMALAGLAALYGGYRMMRR